MSDAIFARPKRKLNISCCRPLFPVSCSEERLTLRSLMLRLTQSFRLMVGVQDYTNYLKHMQQHHPETTPMTIKAFHRYCLEARFPDKAGKMGKCPC